MITVLSIIFITLSIFIIILEIITWRIKGEDRSISIVGWSMAIIYCLLNLL